MILELRGLIVRRDAFTLGPVDARFGPGIWRVAGPNGAGKTTLLRAIVGDVPASGSVLLDGAPLTQAAKRHLGFSPVEPELPDFLGVEEAWRMMAALRAGPVEANAARQEAFGLTGTTRLGACSAGMRRKAELLAAFAGEPAILLLDEPFANLDVGAIAVLSDWLAAWRTERTVLLTHHGGLDLATDGVLDLG